MVDSDCDTAFAPIGVARYRSRLAGYDACGVRVTDVRDDGGLRVRVAWHDDALGAVFIWGTGVRIDGVAGSPPRFVVAAPGTALSAVQQGPCRKLRVGIRGAALRALRDDPGAADVLRPWLEGGLSRPRALPADEWRLQQQILAGARFAEHAARRGVDVERPLAVAAREVTALLLELLRAAGEAEHRRKVGCDARRRSVRRALAVLEAHEHDPVSVAELCRQLRVSERTLQRAFQETLGVGLRAYERERRLRGVHGAILTEGHRRSVTDIAMSFGFWHLGRFAGAYKATFGCSPSETCRRVWPDHHAYGDAPRRRDHRHLS